MRIKKVVVSPTPSTTRFVYNAGGTLLAEYEGEPSPNASSPSKENIYAPSGLLAVIEGGQTQFLTPDHLGSPRVITDSTGAILSRRDFFPFGESIEDTNIGGRSAIPGYSPIPDSIRQKFTGYERDDESGLDFAQARHFASTLGRFMQPDDFRNAAKPNDPQRWNLYNYVNNNPLIYIDPSGEIIQNSRDKEMALTEDQLKKVERDLQAKTGLKNLKFVDGKLTYDPNEVASGGSKTLRDNILGAINDQFNSFILSNASGNESVSFARIEPGAWITGLRTYFIQIDFADYTNAKNFSDSDAYDAFSLGLQIFHEINHKATYNASGETIYTFRNDVSTTPKILGVIDVVNLAQAELGLIQRASGAHDAVSEPGNTSLAPGTLGVQFKDGSGKDKFVRFKKESKRN